jgi:hypothetical protein
VPYIDLQHRSTYREDTNLLAYTVLTGILMANCYYDHVDYLTYATPFVSKSGRAMLHFIKQYYNSNSFLAKAKHIKPHVTTTMSKYSIDDYVEMKSWL